MTPDDTQTLLADGAPAPAADAQGSGIPTVPQLAVALSILAGVFVAPQLFSIERSPSDETGLRAIAPVGDLQPAAPVSPAEVSIEARAAFVWDVERQRAIYNKNADTQLPLASLTKLMTALLASELLGSSDRVSMTVEAIMQEGESGFFVGETLSAAALRDFMLVSSSNDGAFALAAAAGGPLAAEKSAPDAFVDAMNARASELGLARTYFENPTGLDTDLERSGSYGTARDMAYLMEYLLKHHPEVLEPTTDAYTEATTNYAYHSATNTNEVISAISGLLGSKTGFTDLAGGNLVIAYNAGLNRPIIISVLGSSREGRFRDTLALIEYANTYLAAQRAH